MNTDAWSKVNVAIIPNDNQQTQPQTVINNSNGLWSSMAGEVQAKQEREDARKQQVCICNLISVDL